MDNVFFSEDKIDKLPIEKIVKIHLFIKLIQDNKESEYSDRDLNILTLLHTIKGTKNKEEFNNFLELCYSKEFSKQGAANSIRNTLGRAKLDGFVKRKSCNNWRIDKLKLKELDSDIVFFKYLITNIDAKNK